MAEGIIKRHSKRCPARDGGRCRCHAGWEASVYSRRDGKKIRRTFIREAEAKSWRADALGALSRGGLRASRPTTIRQAWEAFYEGTRAGTITNRSGDPYKPATLRSYERAMRLRILPEFGHIRQAELQRPDLQEFADGLLSEGMDPSTIKGTFLPLRAILRRAVARAEVAANACDSLELAAVRGEIELKSRAGRRKVPITAILRDFLLEHRLQVTRADDELAFGRSASTPFDGKAVQERADRAWKAANRRERITAREEGREPTFSLGSPCTSVATPSPR